jgi:Ca-activated chloride channel homolog
LQPALPQQPNFPTRFKSQIDGPQHCFVQKIRHSSATRYGKAAWLPIEGYGGDAMSNSFRSVVRLNPGRLDPEMKRIWILVFVLAFLRTGLSAQSPLDNVHITPRTQPLAADQPEGPPYAAFGVIPPLIKKSVDLVLVPVTVTDPMQRLVTGLTQDNFQVFENKKQQEIKHFSSEDAPVSLGIIVDTSGSMATKMERVREAVKQFCAFSNPQDEFFVITFSEEPHLVHNFSDSPEDIENKLLFATPKGRTALLDAIYMGIRKMRDAKYGKKALLIISDGGDNHSRYSEGELKSAVKESDVMIYAIGTFDRYVPTQEERLGPELLSDIAEITGGRAFILEDDDLLQMPILARRIGLELRTQYVLAYHPENPPHDGKWHKISVKLRLPKKIAYLHAQAKKGYYAAQ